MEYIWNIYEMCFKGSKLNFGNRNGTHKMKPTHGSFKNAYDENVELRKRSLFKKK